MRIVGKRSWYRGKYEQVEANLSLVYVLRCAEEDSVHCGHHQSVAEDTSETAL